MLLALCSRSLACDALVEPWKKPPGISTETNRELANLGFLKHHLHWRKERGVERLGNLLQVTLPVAGRAGARIQS